MYAGCLSIGNGKRNVNEDGVVFLTTEDADYLVSLDGLGGHGGGDLATYNTAHNLAIGLLADNTLFESVQIAGPLLQYNYMGHRDAAKEAGGPEPSPRMGVCVASLGIHPSSNPRGDRAVAVHAGDCRIAVFRDGGVHAETKDHSVTQERLDAKVIKPDDALTDRYRHIVTRTVSLDNGQNDSSLAEENEFYLKEGDVVIMASDGLWDNFETEELIDLIGDCQNPFEIVQKIRDELTRRVGAGGKDDNVNIICYIHGLFELEGEKACSSS
jgi:serine/threonine protein phosphatase PrpC